MTLQKTWWTSDNHFTHRNIVRFTNRGKDTSQENHDRWMTDLWNNQVSKADRVYMLGDFSFAKTYEEIADTVSQLNGQKFFLKGNHDDRKNFDKLVKDNLIAAWYDYKEIKIGKNSVVMFHFPVGSFHKQGHGSWHLHGHSHGNYKDTRGKMLDVGIDNAYNIYGEHRLFSEEDIIQYMGNQPIYISDNHRENI